MKKVYTERTYTEWTCGERSRTSRSSRSGFTLIELLVVITIIAILSIIALGSYNYLIKTARDAKRQADLKFIQSALEDYHADQKYYPASIGSPLVFGSKTYMTKVPNDPKPTPDYSYVASGCTGSACSGYCLFAKLEVTTLTSDTGCSPVAPSPYTYGVTRP